MEHGERVQDKALAPRRYEAGLVVGLTSNEITQGLMKPLAKELRPGLPKT